MDDLVKTKEVIFDAFVEMTSTIGYENVTMRNIAMQAGINAATVYHHFDTKASMLEYAYNYYDQYQFMNRNSLERMKELVETASAEEITTGFMYNHVSENQKHYIRMILITKIIYMRLFQDPLANAMFSKINNNNIRHVSDTLQHGKEIGRIDPDFDILTFADVLIGAMHIMGIEAFADVSYEVQQLDKEVNILLMISRILNSAFISDAR